MWSRRGGEGGLVKACDIWLGVGGATPPPDFCSTALHGCHCTGAMEIPSCRNSACHAVQEEGHDDCVSQLETLGAHKTNTSGPTTAGHCGWTSRCVALLPAGTSSRQHHPRGTGAHRRPRPTAAPHLQCVTMGRGHLLGKLSLPNARTSCTTPRSGGGGAAAGGAPSGGRRVIRTSRWGDGGTSVCVCECAGRAPVWCAQAAGCVPLPPHPRRAAPAAALPELPLAQAATTDQMNGRFCLLPAHDAGGWACPSLLAASVSTDASAPCVDAKRRLALTGPFSRRHTAALSSCACVCACATLVFLRGGAPVPGAAEPLWSQRSQRPHV